MPRHARGKGGRHVKEYTGWGPVSLDEADQLAMSWTSGDTPPLPWAPPRLAPAPAPVQYRPYPAPAPVQPRGMSMSTRLVLAAAACLFSLLLGACVILGVALAMGTPPPAEANVPRETSSVTVVVDHGKVRVKDGTYTLERRHP